LIFNKLNFFFDFKSWVNWCCLTSYWFNVFYTAVVVNRIVFSLRFIKTKLIKDFFRTSCRSEERRVGKEYKFWWSPTPEQEGDRRTNSTRGDRCSLMHGQTCSA